MGRNFSVVYACLFLAFLENSNPSPHLFFFTRYIDDAFGIWTGTKTQLLEYLSFYNTSTQNSLKHSIRTLDSQLAFLDLWINLHNQKFTFNCFQKALNRYQYIPYTSSHPRHVKISFICNEFKRYLIRESTPIGYTTMKKLFYHRILSRGYPHYFILKVFKKYPYSLRTSLLNKKPSANKHSPLVFCLKYTKNTPNQTLQDLLKNIHLDTQLDPQLQRITKPIVCWTKSKNLQSLLVKTKPPPPGPEFDGSVLKFFARHF